MRTLQFKVERQNLSTNGDFANIVRGSKGYLGCQFSFEGNDWIRCKVIAVFEGNGKEYPIPVKSDGSCTVPDEVTDLRTFKVKLVGARDNGYRVLTNPILVRQEG